jgi:acyl-coenzyme A thioesterase PaaI-like protein
MSAEHTTYPPPRHLLRDLRITVDREGQDVVGRLDVVPAILDASGRPRVGVLATLIDVVAGEMAIRSVLPNWTATSELSVQVDELPARGSIEATPRLLRSGRQRVVLEVALRSGSDARALGIGTVGFSVLPARSEFQQGGHWAEAPASRTEFGLPDSGFEKSVFDSMGLEFEEGTPGSARVGVPAYLLNSLNALQGGAVAILLEASAEHFAAACLGGPVRVRSLAVHYLELCRVGPIRAEARSIARTPGGMLVRVELFDEGSDAGLRSLATVQVDESPDVLRP